jgi:predicted membrane GTPase involved in stress response
LKDEKKDMNCILEGIIEHIPYKIFTKFNKRHPKVEIDKPFSMLVSQTESNLYFGKMMIGRIHSGKISVNDVATSVDQSGTSVQ